MKQETSSVDDCMYCKDPGQFTSRPHVKDKRVAGIAFAVCGATALAVYAVATPFVLPALRKICLPYVPATTTQVKHVMRALRGRTGSVIDLGSGDGRLVLEAAKEGFPSLGVELNPWLVWYSQFKARSLKLNHLATFKRCDLWKVKLHSFNNIVIFGVDQMMPLLEEKLAEEMRKDCCVIACRFPLPHWTAQQIIGSGIDTVWVYCKP